MKWILMASWLVMTVPALAQQASTDDYGGGKPYASKGVPKVESADTWRIGRDKIRLAGIDGPSRNQTCKDKVGKPFPCGRLARQYVEDLIANKPVRCEGGTIDRHGQLLALCYLEDGREVNRELVARGWAIAYLRLNKRYQAEMDKARRDMIGIWRARQNEPEIERRLRNDPENQPWPLHPVN